MRKDAISGAIVQYGVGCGAVGSNIEGDSGRGCG